MIEADMPLPPRNFAATDYVAVCTEVFGEDPLDPISGVEDDVIIAGSMRELFEDPESVIVPVEFDGELAGFTLALPIGRMDPSRTSESADTAYIYYTAIKPEFQGKKLVAPLIDRLLVELGKKGFSFVERDSMVDNGYADKVERAHKGNIVNSYDHEKYPEIGRQRFFRISLGKTALSN